nr:recombinase family protein [Rhodococcus sp. UFZ-B548]
MQTSSRPALSRTLKDSLHSDPAQSGDPSHPRPSTPCPNNSVKNLPNNSKSQRYARVSATDQNPELQLDTLNAAACFRVWTDKASGAKIDRPELAATTDALRPGDTPVVRRLDRLGRSLPTCWKRSPTSNRSTSGSPLRPKKSTPPLPATG